MPEGNPSAVRGLRSDGRVTEAPPDRAFITLENQCDKLMPKLCFGDISVNPHTFPH
jgi:hypothetical protein